MIRSGDRRHHVAAVIWAARGVGWVRLFGRQEINLSPRSRPLEACEQQLVPDTIAEVIAPPGGQIKFPREQLPMMTAIRPSFIIGNVHLLSPPLNCTQSQWI